MVRRILTVLVCSLILGAQSAKVDGGLDLAALEQRVTTLKDSTADGDAALAQQLQEAVDALHRAADAKSRATEARTGAAEAPGLLESIRAELALPAVEPELAVPAKASLPDLEVLLQKALAELDGAKGLVVELDSLSSERAKRSGELPAEIAAAQQALTKAREALEALPTDSTVAGRRELAVALVQEYEATLDALEAERANLEARRDLLPLRRDRAARRLAGVQKVANFWKPEVEKRRLAEGEAAARAADAAKLKVIADYPMLEELATENSKLAAMRSGEDGLPTRISVVRDELDQQNELLDETLRRSKAAKRRLRAGGLTEGMGLILRKDFEWLPRPEELRTKAKTHKVELSRAQLELIAIEEERFSSGDLAGALASLLGQLDLSTPPKGLVDVAQELLAARRDAQDALLADLTTLTADYYELGSLDATLVSEVNEYSSYIEKRILWVRSSQFGLAEGLGMVPEHLTKLWSELAPRRLAASTWQAAKARAGFSGLLALLILGLVLARRALLKNQAAVSARVRSVRTDRFGLTVRGLGQVLALALPLPLFIWGLGNLLENGDSQSGRALGVGFQQASVFWLVLRCMHGLLVEKGLGQIHFKWSSIALTAARRELRWFEPIVVIAGALVIALDNQDQSSWSDSIGCLLLVLSMGAEALFLFRLLRPKSEIWASVSGEDRSLLMRTYRLWGAVSAAIPAFLAVIALLGYTYTALQFELRLRETLAFFVLLLLVHALLMRWLFIARRRLAVKHAIEARERREAERVAKDDGEPATQPVDDDHVDIPAVDAKTRQLFKSSLTLAGFVGFFVIWSGVLPALRGLDRVQLLPSVRIASVEAEDGSEGSAQFSPGEPGSSPIDASEGSSANVGHSPAGVLAATDVGTSSHAVGATSEALPRVLTLADLLLALLLVMLTSVAARNLPALLELALLQRLPLDGGVRYAISTLVRYIILVLGVSAISSAVGVGWQQVQWLAAALTFGLAFGLQEIFANFVSGIIILIERPIRVGDIVTVGEVEGRVTQLRMRATTIQDYSRRELLIPNKEFITGNVINWTLTDPVTRFIIPVGIAYGSDTRLARKLLLRVSHLNAAVLYEPEPQVIFRSFGESSLDFELRIFIANREVWAEIIDLVHVQIDDEFRKAGIEIAFPQRDLHVRSMPEASPATTGSGNSDAGDK